MKRNKELKREARAALNGKWGWALLPALIMIAIQFIMNGPNAVCSVLSLPFMKIGFYDAVSLAIVSTITSWISIIGNVFIGNPITVGGINTYKELLKNSDIQTVPNMFKFTFGEKRYWRNVLSMFLVNLFAGLWCMLFIIPGIIKAYAYALTPYLLIDNPEYGANEAREISIEMMRGHKWELFCLDLSFIGWILLGILSLGIGFIWIIPYFKTTRAAFYLNLVEELQSKQA